MAGYQLGTAYMAGFLGRDDGKRPSWMPRARLVPHTDLAADMQEHLNSICGVVCTKTRQEATSEPGARPAVGPYSGGVRPPTAWKAALLCARVLWRTLFATAAAKADVPQKAVPVLFMCVSDSLVQSARKLLTNIWNDLQLEFTARTNKYHNVKSRPPWTVLEGLEYQTVCLGFGFGLNDPEKVETVTGSKPASNLQDWFEEVLALRFVVDWLQASMQDAQEFLDQATRRMLKRAAPRKRLPDNVVSMKLAELKEKTTDSFSMMWTDDAELRGVCGIVARVMENLDGPGCGQFAASITAQVLCATWNGCKPMFMSLAKQGVARITEAHSIRGFVPPPPLQEQDAHDSHTAAFDYVAASYAPPSKDCEELMQALPRGVVQSIVKVQATFRGYIFRARYFSRARSVASYCKNSHWPLAEPSLFADMDDGAARDSKGLKRRKKVAKKADPKRLDNEIAEFQPNVSKYLGGEGEKPAAATGGISPKSTMGSTARMGATQSDLYERRSWPLPTADHRACADLFALYMYNRYRRAEIIRMWTTLCAGYERGMDVFAALLEKNPGLKPMLESISAQLKRGSVVGYDRAFIAKHQEKGAPTGRQKGVEAELFRRNGRTGKPAGADEAAETVKPGGLGATGAFPGGGTQQMTTMLPPFAVPVGKDGKSADTEVAGEYLATYLREMEGDDSQFKDIDSAVIPLSTGRSPARKSPAESILETAVVDVPSDQARAEEGGMKPKRPKLDVPFCLSHLKPMWLPIKAHRFAVYRGKVLKLLPEKVLNEYTQFEAKGKFAACIKLLEAATPGSLNVLSPATLVNNKPLLVDTVMQLIVGYSGVCLKNGEGKLAVKLITNVLDSMSLALRDMHPGHRTVLEAFLFDTALSVCYYMPNDIALTDRSESFFQQASERYLRLNHVNRYCKCCLRAAAVLQQQGNKSEAEYYTHQALNKLSNAPVSALLAVCYNNLAVHTMSQHRLTDGVAHVKTCEGLLRQLPKLGQAWMQQFDNTRWLVLKAQELWPQFQNESNMRDSQIIDRFG